MQVQKSGKGQTSLNYGSAKEVRCVNLSTNVTSISDDIFMAWRCPCVMFDSRDLCITKAHSVLSDFKK